MLLGTNACVYLKLIFLTSANEMSFAKLGKSQSVRTRVFHESYEKSPYLKRRKNKQTNQTGRSTVTTTATVIKFVTMYF